MEIRIGEQALELALALGIGMALGFVYDLLRPPRRHGGKLLAAATEQESRHAASQRSLVSPKPTPLLSAAVHI